jgi:hypothetical protein
MNFSGGVTGGQVEQRIPLAVAFAPAALGMTRVEWRAYSESDVEEIRMRLLLNWVLSAVAVWIVAQVVPGVHVSGAVAALIAALAIGFINATLGRAEDYYVSFDAADAGIVLVRNQCADAGVGVGAGAGISGARVLRGVYWARLC